MKTVRDVLNAKGRDVWTIHQETDLHTALAIMNEKDVGSLLVIDADKNILGIFSERYFARYCAGRITVPLDSPIRDMMEEKVICINEEQTVENCMVIMTEKRIRYLPVQKDGCLTGIISIGDIVNACIHEKEILIDQLEHYIVGSL